MRLLNRLLAIGVVIAMLAPQVSANTAVSGPLLPAADSYTDVNAQDANHGEDQHLLLSASNLTSCVETTYLWFKFDVPSTGATITDASLNLTFGPGAGTVNLELRSSEDTSWSEAGLSWSNQPTLDADALATTTSVTSGSTAELSSLGLAAYLNARQGQTVSLVVRADCEGSVSTSVALALQAREHPDGPAASLTLTLEDSACPDFEPPADIVGTEDIQAVADHWQGSQPYDARYDLAPNPSDGVINILDVMTVVTQLGPCP